MAGLILQGIVVSSKYSQDEHEQGRSNVLYNVTLRRVLVTIFAMEKHF
jgi:hypothetical protein